MSSVLRKRAVSLPLCIGAMIGVGTIGFLAGFGLCRTQTPQSPVSRKAQVPPAVTAHLDVDTEAGGSGNAPMPEDREGLRERVAKQEEEIPSLRTAARSSDPRAKRPALAKHIWETYEKLARPGEEEEARSEFFRLYGQFGDLREEDAPFFVERYRTAKDRKLAQFAIGMACCCGGPEANALVRDVLQDPTVSEEERTGVLSGFLSDGVALIRGTPFAVNDELAAVASRFLVSTNATQRAGAAGLLSGHDSPEMLPRLCQLAERDPDYMVRITAIRSLGWIGDRDTLAHLQAHSRTDTDEQYESALNYAIRRLEKKHAH